MAARSGNSAARSGKKALGAALIARALMGNTSRDPASGRKKSPGLFGSLLIVVFGGVFLGVGLYLHSHSASLRAQPGTKGSPEVGGWICIVVGGLVVLAGGLTLLNRITCLLIGVSLLIVGLFELPQPVSVPVPAQFAPPPVPVVGQSAAPLVPPPIDPQLPMPGR
jgi:hypothetical protein